MKKLILGVILALVTTCLYAKGTTVEKPHEHYSVEANKTDSPLVKEIATGLDKKASKSVQRIKNLNDAVERVSKGKASEADKELIRSEDSPFIKKLQESTVYKFDIDINNPIVYHILAGGGEALPKVFATAIDLYMIKHCTNDLSKMTPEDIQNTVAMKENSVMVPLKYASESNGDSLNASKEDYVKFVHAARAFNCGDSESLRKFLQKDNEFEGTFLTGLSKEDMGDKSVFMSYANEAGNECTVIGHTSPTIPSLGGQFARVEIKLEKETCKSGEAFMIKGYVAKTDGNMIFSNITPDDKVKIVKKK